PVRAKPAALEAATARGQRARRADRKPKAPRATQGAAALGRVRPRRVVRPVLALVRPKVNTNPRPARRVPPVPDPRPRVAMIGSPEALQPTNRIWASWAAAGAANVTSPRCGHARRQRHTLRRVIRPQDRPPPR